MVVLLLERDEEMRRLYGAWLKHREHTVLNCPGIIERKDGRVRCLLLAGLPCPSCHQAEVILYDPAPGEESEQEDVEVIGAIRQSLPSIQVLVVGGREWLPKGIGQLILRDRGIRLTSSNPPDLAVQVSAVEGREATDFSDIEGNAGRALGIGFVWFLSRGHAGMGCCGGGHAHSPAKKKEGMSRSSRSLPWPGRVSKLRNVDGSMS